MVAALVSAFIAVVAAVVAIVQTSAAKDQASSARDSATAAEAQAFEAERSADAAEQQVLEARRAAAAAEATLAQMKIDTADRRREEISRLSHAFIAVSEEWIASVTALIDHLVEHGGQPHPSDESVRSRFMGAANAVIPSAANLLPFFGRAQVLHEPYGDLMRAVQATHSAMQALTSQSSVLGEHEPSVVAVRDSVTHARAQSSRFQTQLIRWLSDFARVDLGLPPSASSP